MYSNNKINKRKSASVQRQLAGGVGLLSKAHCRRPTNASFFGLHRPTPNVAHIVIKAVLLVKHDRQDYSHSQNY